MKKKKRKIFFGAQLIWPTAQSNYIVTWPCGQQLYRKRRAVGLGEGHDTVKCIVTGECLMAGEFVS